MSTAVLLSTHGQSGVRADPTPFKLQLRTRVETSKDSGRYHTVTASETWDPAKTALIVCDVWDLHHCRNAVRRVEEFVPRLEQVLQEARRRGASIIHAPSACMDAYRDHPARRHALAVPRAKELPKDIGSWCSRIPSEERGRYPIDQSDGGEDDDAAEHRAWAEQLQAMGRNPKAPWKKQADGLTIAEQDYISDKGDEIWSILQHRGIDHVILAGVHTNMCVLGRPFGLRQMARNGKHVVLLRDMTDTMYNPERWPFVSHFTGTDLIVEHIEKFVCPTITSNQLIGGKPFRFAKDTRRRLVMLIGLGVGKWQPTLSTFAVQQLGQDFAVSSVIARDTEPHDFPGIEALDEADILLISVHRMGLKLGEMAVVRRFIEAGKPAIGIGTARDVFSPDKRTVQAGVAEWPEFNRQVFGGDNHGPGMNIKGPRALVRVAAGADDHPIVTGLPKKDFAAHSLLFKVGPLADGTTVLLTGRQGDRPPEPVAWIFTRRDKGRSFSTTLRPSDLSVPEIQRLLRNALYWSAGLPVPKEFRFRSDKAAN
jgi:nicotinamidase-related amidase